MKLVASAHAYEPPWRIFTYTLCALAGIFFGIYEPPSIAASSYSVRALAHTVLAVGALAAISGAALQLERYELAGLIGMAGPLLGYTGLLGYGALNNPDPSRYASLGVASLLGALASLLVLFSAALWRFIHESDGEGNAS